MNRKRSKSRVDRTMPMFTSIARYTQRKHHAIDELAGFILGKLASLIPGCRPGIKKPPAAMSDRG